MQENNHSPIVEYLKKTLLDPVLWYTTLIMTAIMYHYYDTKVISFFWASLLMIYVLFRLFDFMNRKKLLGGVLYIAAAYVIFFVLVRYCTDEGYNYYEDVLKTKPMGYGLWFITPQLAMDYNIWYSRATFLMFTFFMASVVYYFSRIRYRVFMSFLIFIIPFMIYGKEYEVMPIFFLILLATGYIVLMFYCRQLKEGASTVIVSRRDILASAGVFTVIFAITASVIPKPEIKENREGIESLISAERFTDRLVASLSAFRGSSSGGQFRGVSSQVPLYYAKTDEWLQESLRLKVRTMSDYSFQYDTWNASKYDAEIDEYYDTLPVRVSENGKLTDALLLAIRTDPELAEKYGFTGFEEEKLRIPATRRLKLYSVFDSGNSVPVPQFAQQMTDSTYDGGFKLGMTGTVTAENNFAIEDQFSFVYSLNTFFDTSYNKNFIDKVGTLNYSQFLFDASNSLYLSAMEADDDSEYEFEKAVQAIEDARHEYTNSLSLLDYNKSSRIKKLSDEITAGLVNDYDKAKALEMYFYNNDYNYDLSYVKTQGENVENFMFNSKRGVCYEYATAMIMLARAANIPARYCEGFGLQSYQENQKYGTNYVITAMDAHAYPELYIKGYGWVPFEPTRSDSTEEQREAGAASSRLSTMGIIMLIAAVIALLLYIASPFLLHKLFLLIYRRKAPSLAAAAAMRRICRLYGLGRTKTSHEVTVAAAEMSGADISRLALLFDRAVYGSEELSEAERDEALGIYTNAYLALRAAKKKQRRLRLRRS